MTFLELWLRMAFLELWLGTADEHEELLSCGSEWHFLNCGLGWRMNTRNSRVVVYVIVSSPYLLMFADDHVHGTREQTMLHVDLVRHRAGAGLAWEILYRALFFMKFTDL